MNLNKEEQEAIRSAKCEIETEKEVGCVFAKWLDIKELEIILNIIGKLQKDNYELDKECQLRFEENIDLKSKIKKYDNATVFMNKHFIDDYYISKDKIKGKIRELEKAPLVYELTIDVLKELLEE